MHIAEQAVHAFPGISLGKPLPVGPRMSPPNSRFELIAAQNEVLPSHLGDLLGLLLQAAYSGWRLGRPVLAPLWAEEGMHRAYAILRLIDRRAERDRGRK